jgi:hypothetical protein
MEEGHLRIHRCDLKMEEGRRIMGKEGAQRKREGETAINRDSKMAILYGNDVNIGDTPFVAVTSQRKEHARERNNHMINTDE